MSIFIRDELNTSGITPGNSESPNVNPHYVGRTQRDTLDTSGDTTPGQADNNPDFINSSLYTTSSPNPQVKHIHPKSGKS